MDKQAGAHTRKIVTPRYDSRVARKLNGPEYSEEHVEMAFDTRVIKQKTRIPACGSVFGRGGCVMIGRHPKLKAPIASAGLGPC
jgi:hypothetical protein